MRNFYFFLFLLQLRRTGENVIVESKCGASEACIKIVKLVKENKERRRGNSATTRRRDR